MWAIIHPCISRSCRTELWQYICTYMTAVIRTVNVTRRLGTIARELKLSRSTVKRALADLEQSGRIRKEQRWRENGGKSSNMFYLA